MLSSISKNLGSLRPGFRFIVCIVKHPSRDDTDARFTLPHWRRFDLHGLEAHLALQNIDLAILDVHVILELGQLGVHAVALLLSLHRGLRLLLDHPVLFLESLSHLLDLRDTHIFSSFNRDKEGHLDTERQTRAFRRVQSANIQAYVHAWTREEEKRRKRRSSTQFSAMA